MFTRRSFLRGATLGAAIQSTPSSRIQRSERAGEIARNRLWLWGHYEGSHNNDYGIPGPSRITPVEAAAYMNLDNIIMVELNGKPVAPYSQYALPFASLKEVVWSIASGGGNLSEVEAVLDLSSKINLTGLIFDDFFNGTDKDGKMQAAVTLSALEELRKKLTSDSRHLDLWVVVYARELPQPLDDYLTHFDVVTLWNWTSPEIDALPSSLTKLETLAPKARKVLGCYMWDYGQSKPMPIASMERQCEQGLNWLKQGRIDGMIFLASCICDLGLETVEWTRSWIQEVGKQPLANRKQKALLAP